MPTQTHETILGLDPGIGSLGFGVIERRGSELRLLEAGVIRTAPRRAHPSRLVEVYDDLRALVRRVKPTRAAVERLFFVQNVTTGMGVSEARGVALLVLAQAHIPLVEFTPAEVKQTLTGFGRADKRQVREMVKRLLKLRALPGQDDASDGLAIAICGAGAQHHT